MQHMDPDRLTRIITNQEMYTRALPPVIKYYTALNKQFDPAIHLHLDNPSSIKNNIQNLATKYSAYVCPSCNTGFIIRKADMTMLDHLTLKWVDHGPIQSADPFYIARSDCNDRKTASRYRLLPERQHTWFRQRQLYVVQSSPKTFGLLS